MKIFALTFLLILFVFSEIRAQYVVLKVIGKITTNGRPVKPSNHLSDNAIIKYASLNDRLIVIKIGQGEKIFQPSPQKPLSQRISELVGFTLHLNSASASLSGRGSLTEKVTEALQASPNSNCKIVIEQQNKFLFDPKEFPQTNGATFFIQIDIPDQKPVPRKLKTNNDTLLISYSDLVTDKMDSTVKYKIGYRDADRKSHQVTSFDPYFAPANETEDMIAAAVIACKLENLTKDAARDSVYSIVYANSGKPNGISFAKLFDKYWLINQKK